MVIEFIKTHEDAKLPVKNHSHSHTGDAGFDLFAVESVIIKPGESAIVPVGLKLGFIEPGYWFRIEPRSGLGFKKNLQPHLGVIDNGYRGDLGIKIYNFGKTTQEVLKGTGVAQFVVYQMIRTEVRWTDTVTPADRGEKGFGSSGF